MSDLLKFFGWQHLAPHLQAVSRPCGELATKMDLELPPSQQKEFGMQRLLEAKDCFVRAKIEQAAG